MPTQFEIEAENARLRFEVEVLTAQRNSAHRRAKRYHRKWKTLIQEQEAAPTALKLLTTRLQADFGGYTKSSAECDCEEALVRRSIALYLERLLAYLPKCQEEAVQGMTTPADRPRKPQGVIEAIGKWLKSQVEYKKQSRNDVSYGWGDGGDDDDRLMGAQGAYEEAFQELKRLRGNR
jgi:hypothetical protein